jgi:MYXO-CTERM domain-containing protein
MRGPVAGAVVVLTVASGAGASPPANVRLEQWNAVWGGGPNVLNLPQPSKPGDLVVVIAAGDSSVCTMSDSAGNTYLQATPTVAGIGVLANVRQTVLYSANIVATPEPLRFDVACGSTEARVLEYSGIAQSAPLDVIAFAAGSTSFADSGFVMTTAAPELVVAGVASQGATTGVGTGFTSETNFGGDLVEDMVLGTQASVAATCPTDPFWIANLATFRVDTSLDAGPPIVMNPGAGIAGPLRLLQANSGASVPAQTVVPLLEPTTPGSMFIVCTMGPSGTAFVTDTASSTWILVASASTNARWVSMFYASNPSLVPAHVEFTTPGGNLLQVLEYAGNPLSQDGSGFGHVGEPDGGVTTLNIDIDTPRDGDLLVLCGSTAGTVIDAGPGLIQRQRLLGNLIGDSFAPFAGHYALTATSDDPSWWMTVAAFHLDGYDAGPRDAGSPDAGTPDAGTDGGSNDSGTPDAGAPDSGTSDAGHPDGGPWSPLVERVGCACQSTDAAGMGLALLALGRSRRRADARVRSARRTGI